MNAFDYEDIKVTASNLSRKQIREWLKWLDMNRAQGAHAADQIEVGKILIAELN